MTNPVKDRSGLGLPPKAERRAAGKVAAKKRAQAKRRRKIGNNLLVLASGLAVVALLLFTFGVFDGDSGTDGQTPGAISTDMATRPIVGAGEGALTELKVLPTVIGTGAVVQDGQLLTVQYVGVNYATGEEFDASWGKQPFSFTIGRGEVIKGWDEGLIGITVGSRVQLDVPADLAYGDDPSQGAASGALRFVVDVVSAEPAAAR